MNISKGKILLAGYQSDFVSSLSTILTGEGYHVIPSETFEHAGTIVEGGDIDAVITDLGLSNYHGLRLFEHIEEVCPIIPVIFLTACETIELAISALTRGAFHYFVTPPDYPQLKNILARAIEHCNLKREITLLKERLSEMAPIHRIIGNTLEMQKTIEVMEAIKESTSTVLISGETGTGKELIARTLHSRSSRHSAPFIPINCAAIPKQYIEAELFGCRRKLSNGGTALRSGRFEKAGEGIVFLDEVGQLGPRAQSRLLQVLRDGHITTNGADHKVEIRFRLVSSTTEHLEEKVSSGSFSDELYHIIKEIEIKVPPLRERREDIPLLASALLNELSTGQSRKLALSSEVLRAFQYHDWPGNVRQLKNVIEHATVLARGSRITLHELPRQFTAAKKRTVSQAPVKTLKQLEMHAILETLRKCNGNKSRTARMLGISRKAFYKRLREAEVDGLWNHQCCADVLSANELYPSETDNLSNNVAAGYTFKPQR